MEQFFAFIQHDIQSGMTIIFACLVLICIACLIDMWTAIDAARANKERIRSKPLRKTGVKIVDYFRLLMFFVMIDLLGLCFVWYNMPYGAIIGTVGVLAVEGVSVVENFRRKRSHAAEVAEVVSKIVSCVTKEEAEKIIIALRDQQTNNKIKNYQEQHG